MSYSISIATDKEARNKAHNVQVRRNKNTPHGMVLPKSCRFNTRAEAEAYKWELISKREALAVSAPVVNASVTSAPPVSAPPAVAPRPVQLPVSGSYEVPPVIIEQGIVFNGIEINDDTFFYDFAPYIVGEYSEGNPETKNKHIVSLEFLKKSGKLDVTMRELRKHHAQEALNWFAQEGIEYKVVVRIKDDGSEEIIEDKKEAKKALEDGSAEEVTRYKKPCNSTVKNCRSALRLITKKAVENDVIGTDIFSGMRLPNATKVEESRDIVVPAVFNKVLESAKSDILLYTYLLLVWHTGIRPGEARALAWKNINFGEDYIYICEAEKYKRIGEGGIGETKTGKKRYVILVPELAEALRLLKKEQEAVLGTCKRVLMVLHGKNKGKLATEATLSNRLRNLLERHLIKNGVLNERDYFSIYNIRHTWITNGLKNKYTSSQMALASGNSVEMIETVYSKMNSRDVLEQMKKDMGLAQ